MKISKVTELIEKYRYCDRCGSDEIVGMLVISDTFILNCVCGRKVENSPERVVVTLPE